MPTGYTSSSSWECVALNGERVKNGDNFVPGPDYCTACKCENGEAKFCRAALCQPPQDCQSFRVGETCCEFICLDDILPTRNDIGHPDAGLRMVASAITAIMSLALFFFLIHRLRQKKLRMAEDQFFEDQLGQYENHPDSCRNNACCHNALYMTGNDHVDFFLDGYTPPYSPWKPPSYTLGHGEPPPPYSEVMANDRSLAGSLPALNPLMMELNSSRALQPSHRVSVSLRNSVIVSEALSQAGMLQSLPSTSSRSNDPALLSDQVYSNCSSFPTILKQSHLNDLNKETSSSVNNATAKTTVKTQCASSDKKKVKQHNKAISSTREESVIEDFRLRLLLDISDSSNSTFSNPRSMSSDTSRSSEDVPSIVSNAVES